MIDIKTLTFEDIEKIVENYGEKKFRARQIWSWLWQYNADDFVKMTNLPLPFRQALAEKYTIRPINIDFSQQSKKDFTIKYSFKTHDNKFIEGVLIPSSKDSTRITACISTQIGCPLNCAFCATGKLGFSRNLTKAEIYEQVYLLNAESIQKFGKKLSNIVIMGMGEPLLNLDNVLAAIELITNPNLLGFSPQRITLSTVGIYDKIKALAESNPRFNLAISLHTADDFIRNELMPANKKTNLQALIDALKYYHHKTQQRITIEYILFDGINDSIDDAKKLAQFCKNFPVKINLIEYNTIENSALRASPAEKVKNFANFLLSKNLVVTIRHSKGKDIDAACGQLANKRKNT